MAVLQRTAELASALLTGRSIYQPSPRYYGMDEATAARMRRNFYGGELRGPSDTPTRWYLSDLEAACHQADMGDLFQAAKLMTAARSDGVVSGVLSTRTSGLVRLPKVFRGNPRIIAELELGHDATRSIFDEMCPPQELATMAADGELLGIAVGELVPIVGRAYPLLVRLDPAFLRYMWNDGRWYYQAVTGLLPIIPGDGRWVLHTPGGRVTPWQHGLWKSVGRSYIRKDHAAAHKDSWEGKLAHPARVAVSPQGSTEGQRNDFFQRLMAWGINSVFALTPGYDIKLVESNGRGYESFLKTIAEANTEITICIAGQTVTTDGGTGFANADIHKSIRADLIKATADSLALTINTQIIPHYILAVHGPEALTPGCYVAWDVTPPQDRGQEASALVTTANAIKGLTEALAAHGIALDVLALCARFGVPVLTDRNRDALADVDQLVVADAVEQDGDAPLQEAA